MTTTTTILFLVAAGTAAACAACALWPDAAMAGLAAVVSGLYLLTSSQS